MKILITNEEKINKAIKEAEGRATERTISYDSIQHVLDVISRGITKSKLHGTKVFYDGSRHFPKSYKYRADATQWKAENIKGKWYVTDIFRSTCHNRVKNTYVTYSEEAKQQIIDNASYLDF